MKFSSNKAVGLGMVAPASCIRRGVRRQQVARADLVGGSQDAKFGQEAGDPTAHNSYGLHAL